MGKTIIPKSFKANIQRALHNLYQEKSTTLHPMTLIPIYYRRMFKGDRFDFAIMESILRSEPTFAPLLSNWRLQFEWYFDSDANRYCWIDNNTRLTAEEVMNRKHHTFRLPPVATEGDAYEFGKFIGRGSIHDFAGFAPGAGRIVHPETEEGLVYEWNFDGRINIDFHLTYLNIIRNYHVNKQFPNVPYISGNNVSGSSTYYKYNEYSLKNLDDLFMFLRSCPNGVMFEQSFNNSTPLGYCTNDAPANLKNHYSDAVAAFSSYLVSSQGRHCGIFCAEYEPDLYQNLLNKDQGLMRSVVYEQNIVDENNMARKGFTIESFRLQNHLQGLYDKIFVSGGTDRDLSRTIWGIDSNRDYDIPELLCVHSEIIGTNLVTSSTAANGTYNGEPVENAPGSMQGNLNTRRGAGRSQRFTAKTSGSLMCIVSLVPIVTYNENIERHLLEHNFMDEFTPDMARKGFETVPLSDYCALPELHNNNSILPTVDQRLSTVVGKQVAWLREMTAVNRCHGEFSNGGENYDWILHRTYLRTTQSGKKVLNISPYGLPTEFQYPFVATDLLSPNFNLQVAIKCDAYRPIPRKFMPNLGY